MDGERPLYSLPILDPVHRAVLVDKQSLLRAAVERIRELDSNRRGDSKKKKKKAYTV